MPDSAVSYNESDKSFSGIYSYSFDASESAVSSSGKAVGTIKAFDVIPVKNVKISKRERKEVYVSGEIFGIKLYTDGVIVVGTQSVDIDGEKINPAAEAGIETGDIIVSINNIRVYSADEVTAIFNDNNGLPYNVKLKRDGRYKSFTVKPVYSPREGCYKAGMWVRDSGAGIGTMTFYNPENGTFASLGHQINDVDTNAIMPLLQGEAVSASVTKIQKGNAGEAGSLWCDFEDYTLGKLLENSPLGLYGAYSQISEKAQKYEVSSPQEVEKGSAVMLSTVEGKAPRLYNIEIIRISYNKSEEQKDIVFKVTDKSLLEKTGGIVQGMSGSPIIQNGRLVGAVTHVIVNNSEKGYAIFAQTMLEKAEAVE